MNIAVEIEPRTDIAEGNWISKRCSPYGAGPGRPAETTEVSITLTTDEEVHRLNEEFRGIDHSTDVLSLQM